MIGPYPSMENDMAHPDNIRDALIQIAESAGLPLDEAELPRDFSIEDLCGVMEGLATEIQDLFEGQDEEIENLKQERDSLKARLQKRRRVRRSRAAA